MQNTLTNSQAELLLLAGLVETAEINEASFIAQEQSQAKE